MVRRRDFLAGMAAGAALAGLPLPPARAADAVTFYTPLGIVPEFLDVLNAYSGGHFARQGLDVKMLGAMGVQSLQLLVAGQGQFIRNTALDLIKAVSTQGPSLISIGTLTQASTFHLVSLAAKPVADAEALKGKTVGLLTPRGGASSQYLDVILDQVGIHPDDVTYVVTGNNPGALEYIRDGRVDCFMCSYDVVIRLALLNEPIAYWSTDKYLKIPSQVYVTTRAIAEQQPDLALRFMRAIKASVDEIMTEPLDLLYTRAERDFDIPGLKDMPTAVTVMEGLRDNLWLSEGRDNLLRNVPDLWHAGVEALRADGFPNIQTATAYYTNEFIDKAMVD